MNYSEYKNQITALLIALLLVIGGVVIALLVTNQNANTDTQNVLTVEGEATISYTPDEANFNISINAEEESSEIAKNSLDEKTNAVLEILESLEIPEENIQTSSYSVYPQYNYERIEETPDTYVGTNSLDIKIVDLTQDQETLTQLLEQVSEISGVSIFGPYLDVSNREELLDLATEQAVANATKKAEKLAQAANVKLGAVVSIDAGGNSDFGYPYPAIDSFEGSSRDEAVLPEIKLGEMELSSSVTVSFRVK